MTQTRTLYWDDRDRRWVFLVKEGVIVTPHKFSKTIVDREKAEELAATL